MVEFMPVKDLTGGAALKVTVLGGILEDEYRPEHIRYRQQERWAWQQPLRERQY